MRASDSLRTGGEILIDQLVIHGARHIFCVPGESYIAALDACNDRDLALTICRQESGAAMMAEAVGKATGRPGICFVTRGPGATNASAGVHIARQDSTPLILFVGQIARHTREREAFQELDYRAVFGSIAKWATEIDDPARIPEIVSRAYLHRDQRAARPGGDRAARGHAGRARRGSGCAAVRTGRDLARPHRHEPAAEDDLGGGAADRAARRQPLVGGGLCVGAAFRRAVRAAGRHHVPPRAPVRPGPPLLCRRPRHRAQSEASGAGEGRRSHHSGRRPARRDAVAGLYAARHSGAAQTLVHVFPDVEELGRVYRAELAINAAPTAFAAALEGLQPPNDLRWADETPVAHADFLAWTDTPTKVPGPVNMGEIVASLAGEACRPTR